MKQILWLTPGFAADENDSRCIPPLQLLAKGLQESAEVKIRIIALHYPYKKEPFFWNGIKVFPCYQTGLMSRIKIWLQVIRYFRQIIQTGQIDVVHSFWLTDAALIGHWLSAYYQLPHWVTLMGQDARPSNRYLRFFPLKKMNTVALSGFHNDQLQQTTGYAAKRIIPWGMEPIKVPEHSESRPIDILGVGNLIPLKDYETFVRLVAKYKKSHPEFRAVLIGDGTERSRLEALAKELQVSDQLEFKGYLERAEVLELMQQSKVLLHPSTYESFGFVFLEALACGMKIVSRRVGITAPESYWQIGDDITSLFVALEQVLLSFDQPKIHLPLSLFDNIRAYIDLYHRS